MLNVMEVMRYLRRGCWRGGLQPLFSKMSLRAVPQKILSRSKFLSDYVEDFCFCIETTGAYAVLIGIGPEIIQILLSFPQKRFLLFSNWSRPVQADVIKVHLARTTGD